MNYMSSLKALRAKMQESAQGVQQPLSQGLESFIPSRMQTDAPQESTEDIITRTASWVSDIKKAAVEMQKAYETASKGSETAPAPAAAFAEGFSSASSKAKEAERQAVVPEVQAANQKAFVARRSETSPSNYAPTRPTEIKSFKDAIDMTEGGGDYDALFGYSNRSGKQFDGFSVSNMTIGEIKAFSDPKGEYGQWVKGQVGRVATPMGRYQFVGTTLKAMANEMGLDDNTVFSPEVQDAMFEHYLQKRINSGGTLDEKVSQIRQAWEGFKHVPTPTLKALITQREAM